MSLSKGGGMDTGSKFQLCASVLSPARIRMLQLWLYSANSRAHGKRSIVTWLSIPGQEWEAGLGN